MKDEITVLGGDRRMAYLAQQMKEAGCCVHTWGLDSFGVAADCALCEAAAGTVIVLPTPLSRPEGRLNAADSVPIEDLFRMFRPGQRLYAGNVKPSEYALAHERGTVMTDYLKNEAMAVRNAVPTAEGAIECAIAHTDFTLCAAPCLVLGFGRIGKLLAHRLHGLGAEVTVSARKFSDLAWIDAFGYRGLPSEQTAEQLGLFRVIFNTVPQPIIDAQMLAGVRRDCLLVDLTESGGFDADAAKALGLTCVKALGLPGRTAPESAARTLLLTLQKIWEEES